MRIDRSQPASDADRSRPDPIDQGNVGGARSLLGQALDRLSQLGKDGADRLDGAIFAVFEAARIPLGKMWDAVAPGFEEAMIDVRKKVFEEAWFGREVTPHELIDDTQEVKPARLGFRDLMKMQADMLPRVDPDAPGQNGAPSHSPDR